MSSRSQLGFTESEKHVAPGRVCPTPRQALWVWPALGPWLEFALWGSLTSVSSGRRPFAPTGHFLSVFVKKEKGNRLSLSGDLETVIFNFIYFYRHKYNFSFLWKIEYALFTGLCSWVLNSLLNFHQEMFREEAPDCLPDLFYIATLFFLYP